MTPEFRRVPDQTARLYIYPDDSEHPKLILITAPIEVRQTQSAEEVVHLSENGEEETFEVPYGWAQLNISRAMDDDVIYPNSAQSARDVMENGNSSDDSPCCPPDYRCEDCAPNFFDEEIEHSRYPCTSDPNGMVSSGNECMNFPMCGCERTQGDGGSGDPPDFSSFT